jgi:hypothetical protein
VSFCSDERDRHMRVNVRSRPTQVGHDATASEPLRNRDERGDDWADIIDLLTMHPEERRRVVRLLGEIDAG